MRQRSSPNRFSHSKLTTFENCPQQYKFNYIMKIKTDIQGVEAHVGSVVHDCLEWVYDRALINRIPSEALLREFYEKFWASRYSDSIRIVKEGATIEEYKAGGFEILQRYYKSQIPVKGFKVLFNELHVESKFSEHLSCHGYIDRVDLMEPNHIRIVDYKTSNSKPTSYELDFSQQLSMYQIMLHDMLKKGTLVIPGVNPGEVEFSLMWVYLRHDKFMTTARTPLHLKETKEWVLKTIESTREAEELNHFPARLSFLCNWCGFQDICESHQADKNGTDPSLVSSSKPKILIEV